MKNDQKRIIQVLNYCYDKALDGLPGSKSAELIAQSYLAEKGTLDQKIDHLIRWQNLKCSTSGFITGLGGIMTLPLTIPANIGANYYILLRMIAAIALMRGYDVRSEKVQALAFACLCGNSAKDILKNVGIQFGRKMTTSALRRISSSTIIQINQIVGVKLITKFGQSGVIDLGKAVPILGGLVGGVIDGVSCHIVGDITKKVFTPLDSEKSEEEVNAVNSVLKKAA